jgi:membrane-associated phospholipid phosphatase
MTQELERNEASVERTQDDAAPASAPASGESGESRHGPIAQLLIAWSPLSVILLAYAVAGWISGPLHEGDGAATNRLGFGVHLTGPPSVDRGFFGAVPSVWLQERLVDGSPHWYDAVAALVYVTHFVSIPIVTAVAWFWLRDRFSAWLGAVLVFTTLGVTGYVVYPAMPPWLASEQGEIGTVARISDVGWEWLHLDWLGWLTVSGQSESNPVAAMPSLHAGAALLVALFLWPLVGRLWRVVLVAYALAMGLTLVYTGEHYVVDVVAGWLVAAVAIAAGGVLQRRGDRRASASGIRRVTSPGSRHPDG